MGRAADDAVEVRPVTLEDVLRIRQRILRPHQRVEDVEFDGDRRPGALHVGAFVAGRLVGAASVLPDAHPEVPDPNAWRIRGMAVDDDLRDRGIGGALLERCIEHARSSGGTLVWCNARIRAVPFYERHGFVTEGEPFDVEVIGPHVRMRRTL
ncbi:MAG: GNAT family N-acetyltransferase [Actinomycetota bacterium]